MPAKKQALKDIREDLKKEGRAFIAYKSELNTSMRNLVHRQLREQKSLNKRKADTAINNYIEFLGDR